MTGLTKWHSGVIIEGRICLINLAGIWSNPDEECFNDEIIIISSCSITDSRTIDFAQEGPRNCFQDLELEEGTTRNAVVFPTSAKNFVIYFF